MPEHQSFVLYIVVGSGSKSGSRLPKNGSYRRNLGRVSRVQAMDRAQESIVVAALARFLSHVLVVF